MSNWHSKWENVRQRLVAGENAAETRSPTKRSIRSVVTYPYAKAYADDIDVIIGVLWLLAVVRLLPFGERLRGVIPEPFDILNHISNLVLSITVSYYLALVVAKLLHAGKLNPHRALTVSRLIVSPGVIALNFLFETQTGTEFIGSSSTPDEIDLVYGSIGAGFGVLILRVDSRGFDQASSV